jgi:hypothetical protein
VSILGRSIARFKLVLHRSRTIQNHVRENCASINKIAFEKNAMPPHYYTTLNSSVGTDILCFYTIYDCHIA